MRDLGRDGTAPPTGTAPLLGRLEAVRVALAAAACTAAGWRAPRRRTTSARSSSPARTLRRRVLHEHLRRRAADARVEAACRGSSAEARRRAAPAGRRTATSGSTRSAALSSASSTPSADAACRRRRRGRRRSHIASGSGAPSSPTSSGCQVCCPTPMRHGVRGSTAATATSPASSACASRRTPSGPPWRPRSGRSSSSARLSFLYASRRLMPRPSHTLCLVACTASGALAVMRRANSYALSSSCSRGTIALSNPISYARSAGMRSAHSRNSIACGNGIWRGSRTVVPPPANRPRLGSITANLRLRARDADVDAAEHLHPAGGAEAVDRGDDRLPDLGARSTAFVPSSSR